jgi:endonuclease-8
MPEGDTIFRTARTLLRALGGQPVTRFESVLPKLERVDYDTPLAGRIVENVEARGKWLLIYFSGDLILLTHMLMSGSWHIYRPGEPWQRARGHMRIVIETPAILAVAFNVPVAEFHTARSLARREGFNRLGPAPLAADFDSAAAIANLASRPDLELGLALLDQKLMAGLGNVFKSEVAFACGLSPFRLVGTLSREHLESLVATARKFLAANVTDSSGDRAVTFVPHRRTTGRADTEENLWVYARAGEPCRRCGTPIRSAKHRADGRISFWCPVCQT